MRVVYLISWIVFKGIPSQMGGRKFQFIPRAEWGGMPALEKGEELVLPIRSLLLTHTATPRCKTYEECCNTLKVLQHHYYDEKNFKDLPFNFMVSSRRFFEGRGWNINGIPKPPKEEEVNKYTYSHGDGVIEDFLNDLNTYKENKKKKKKVKNKWKLVNPAKVVQHLKKKQNNFPYQPGISIAYIDDFVPKPRLSTRRIFNLFDFIVYGIKKKVIHKNFRLEIEEGPTLTTEDKLDYLWKGRENTAAYKIAMKIRKLNDDDVKHKKPQRKATGS